MPAENLLPLQLTLMLCVGFLCLASSGKLLAVNQITISPTLFWPTFLLLWGAGLGFVCVEGRVGTLAGNLASVFAGATYIPSAANTVM